MKKRQLLRNSLLAFGTGLVGFGWWGLETSAGRHYFDEMAGIIPFSAGIVGTGLIAGAIVLSAVRHFRR